MNRAIYPGSFDPVTFGHLDIIKRAVPLFDQVVVGVVARPVHPTLFSAKERQTLLQQALAQHLKRPADRLPRVKIFDGLLVDFAKKESARVIIRGLRAVTDFDYELAMALANRQLEPKIETIFLMPRESLTFLSSTLVREIAALGGKVSKLVPSNVLSQLKKKFAKGGKK